MFEKLRAYQLAQSVSCDLQQILRSWPRGSANLSDQLQRGAISIPINLAEGCGRQHAKDRRQFFAVSLGSLNECVSCIDMAYRQIKINRADLEKLKTRMDVLHKMIRGLMTVESRAFAAPKLSSVNPNSLKYP